MKSPCFFVEIFAEKRREVCLMRGQDAVSVFKGVGEQREKRLHRLGIVTVEDLLTHYPREYKDRSEILKIADLPPDEPATFGADKGGGTKQPPRQACVYQNEGLR